MHKPINKYDGNLLRVFGIAIKICLILNIIALIVLKFTTSEKIVSSRAWHTVAPLFAGTASLSLITLILYNGIRSVGTYEGKNTFGSQLLVVMKRLTMYLFLPAALISLLLFLSHI